ncbi:MAG TPA: hypothetical protein VMI54_14900 [Polyangiaceae bacterium]|nr:hypothetical protein [Polyangiaceae bacterium]
MAEKKETPEAAARVTADELEARASGSYATAAASRGVALAEGVTSAAAGVDHARATAPISPAADGLLEDMRALASSMQDGMRNALTALEGARHGQAQLKDTVDDLYAAHFAKQVRAGSPLQSTLMTLLKVASGLPVKELIEVLGALGTPKS